jgi:hypothetical protein
MAIMWALAQVARMDGWWHGPRQGSKAGGLVQLRHTAITPPHTPSHTYAAPPQDEDPAPLIAPQGHVAPEVLFLIADADPEVGTMAIPVPTPLSPDAGVSPDVRGGGGGLGVPGVQGTPAPT